MSDAKPQSESKNDPQNEPKNEPKNFLRDIVEADLDAGKHDGRVHTRFPPEPNGYPHIGHAKSICLNFGLAEDFKGLCNLRFDDTNPETEDTEYVEAIKRDVRWLGFDWDERLYHASDYFERLYDCAVHLIERGKAYVDSSTGEEIRERRGTITEPGVPSPDRDRSVEENLDLFRRMKEGEFGDGEHVLRAKIDMAAKNMLMRDPILYRIRHAEHYRRGDAWCIYPMYDFTHCLSDAFEGITHSICTLEFENNRELYDWVIRETEVEHVPRQYEFARLNLSYTVTSKRKLQTLVREGHVAGWDDPRMPTLSGLRRRGVTPAAIRDFCDRIGVAKSFNVIDVALLEWSIRNDLNMEVPRVLAVLDPLKVVIENYPAGENEELDAPLYPHDVPKEGSRRLPFSREIYIEREDFAEDPPKGFHRLAPGREVRLRYAYFITCDKVIKNDAGEIVELRCTYDPETRGGDAPDGRKVKGTLHWVSAETSVPATVRLYDRLFLAEDPNEGEDGAGDADFRQHLNPGSLAVIENARLEASLAGVSPGERFQFERQGYFIADEIDSKPGKPVMNRIVTLRDTWSKITEKESKGETEVAEIAAKKAAEKAAHKARQRAEAKKTEQEMPVLTSAEERVRDRYLRLGLSDQDAHLLARDPALVAFLDDALKAHKSPETVTNWVVNVLLGKLEEKSLADLPFGGAALGELVAMVDDGRITATVAKQIFDEMMAAGGRPEEIVAARGLEKLDDAESLGPQVDAVLAREAANVAAYRDGKKALMGYFIGQVMQATGGRANAKLVKELLAERLG